MSLTATAEVGVRIADLDDLPPLRSRKSRAHGSLRVLGQDEEVFNAGAPAYRRAEELYMAPFAPAPQAETWFDREIPYTVQPDPYSYGPPAANEYWPESHYDDNWQYDAEIQNPKSKIQNRVGLPGKRLPLFIILTLMAVGLVVAITPVLARGHIQARSVGMSLSNYMNGSSSSQLNAQIPIIDVTTNQPTIIEDPNPKSQIPNPKSGDVVGPPSISVNQIEAVLKQYGSPASGKGQTLYDLGIKYGIDPAYALAFFVHESRLRH